MSLSLFEVLDPKRPIHPYMHAHAYAGSSLSLLSTCTCSAGMTGGGNGGRGACAVCKHQRRKCEPNCELATYFPAHRMNDFRALHLVFGVANLTKLIKANASDAARRRAAETLTWEARWRERDPSDGCYREVSCLRRDNAVLRAENAALRRQLAEQQQLLLGWSSACSTTGGALLHSASAINGTPPCGGNGLLTAARPHHAPAAPAAMHTTLAYRGMPVCTTTTANGGGRRPASDATAIAVRGSGGQVDASRDNKSSAR